MEECKNKYNNYTIHQDDWVQIVKTFQIIKKDIHQYVKVIGQKEDRAILQIKTKAFLEILKINEIKFEELLP